MSTLTVGTISEKVVDAGVAVDGVTLKDGDVTIADKIIHDGDTNTAIRFPSADTVTFETGGSEAVRIDSSQNLLVSGTSTAPHTLSSGGGFIVRNLSALLSVARAGNECAIFNRTDSDGNIVSFRKGGTTVGNLGAEGSDSLYIQGGTTSGCGLHFHPSTAQIAPLRNGARIDNAIDIGGSSHRFDDVRATNGTIQTSDRNDKQDIEELSDAEKRVAVVAKGLMRKFRWKDKVAEKGDNARTHFGIIAQDLQDAFTAESLDASDYAMFCSDTWWQKEITVDAVVADEANGIEARDAYTYMDIKNEATEGYTEKTRLGVRYSELLAFIISAI